MASTTPISPLRQIMDSRLPELLRDIESYIDAQTAGARDRARKETADLLNQAVRRMRSAPTSEELLATLLDAAAGFSPGIALFRIEGNAAKGDRLRGAPEDAQEKFRSLEIPLASAAALAGVVESREPMVAATTAVEVSPEIATLLKHAPEDRASIFPVVFSDRVPALLYAWGAVEAPLLEMLAQVAGSVWRGLPAPAPPDLIAIAPAEPVSAWDRLSPQDQQTHLRAQRFARVQVAEMRLHQSAAVQAGRVRHDVYGALRQPIDAARAAFRDKFFAACPSMVDYLHLELLRTLANDDSVQLGKDYPGPLA